MNDSTERKLTIEHVYDVEWRVDISITGKTEHEAVDEDEVRGIVEGYLDSEYPVPEDSYDTAVEYGVEVGEITDTGRETKSFR